MKANLTLLTMLSAVFCLSLTSCKSNKGLASSDGTGTPPTDMAPEDYPFDAEGNYRQDWVAGEKVVDLTDPNSSTPFYDASGSSTTKTSKPATRSTVSRSSTTKTRSTVASKPRPRTTAKVASKPKPKPKPKPVPSYGSHTVQKGDTLYSLARKYGTTVSAIKSASGLKSDTIKDGSKLRIPKK